MTTERDWDGAQKKAGWVKGKRVWFKDDALGVLAAQVHRYASGVIADETEQMTMGGATILLTFPDGQRRVIKERLRLTEPKPRKPREPKAKDRPEAIDPALGEELTTYDLLAEQ